jgi:hypothetical protein
MIDTTDKHIKIVRIIFDLLAGEKSVRVIIDILNREGAKWQDSRIDFIRAGNYNDRISSLSLFKRSGFSSPPLPFNSHSHSDSTVTHRNKIIKIIVTTIPSEMYPRFQKNPSNLFAGMDDEKRINEIIDICGRVWARTNQEIVKETMLIAAKTAKINNSKTK